MSETAKTKPALATIERLAGDKVRLEHALDQFRREQIECQQLAAAAPLAVFDGHPPRYIPAIVRRLVEFAQEATGGGIKDPDDD